MGTYSDIRLQLGAWAQAVEHLRGVDLDLDLDRRWVFTGCGASFHAATSASWTARLWGADAVAAPASEVWIDPRVWLRRGSVLVALSRTGTTTETVQAMHAASRCGASTIGLSLDPGSPVVESADFGYGLPDLGETARVMTRSVSALCLAAQWVAAAAGRRVDEIEALARLAGSVSAHMDAADEAAQALAHPDVSNVVFLGSGSGYGIARQAALQLQETSELAAAAYHPLEYRHGPMAGLDPQTTVVMLSSARARRLDDVLAADVTLLGGRFALCGDQRELVQFSGAGHRVVTSTGATPTVTALGSLPFLQLLGFHQTVAVDRSNESVRNLDRSVDPHVNPHVLPSDLVTGAAP